jgi:hypothetical protein
MPVRQDSYATEELRERLRAARGVFVLTGEVLQQIEF